MKILDPGHRYEVEVYDGEPGASAVVAFVKREGEKYPDNVGTHAGTISQEMIRVLIDRAMYVDNQEPHKANLEVVICLRYCLWELEWRAAGRRGELHKFPSAGGRPSWDPHDKVELEPTCPTCGHIRCGVHVVESSDG